jgi:hypothetical protein
MQFHVLLQSACSARFDYTLALDPSADLDAVDAASER